MDSDIVARIRAKAMSPEGISDEEMAAFQQEKLRQIAQREGGPAAIRAALARKARPKVKPRQVPARQERDASAWEDNSMREALSAPQQRMVAAPGMMGMAAAKPEPSVIQILKALLSGQGGEAAPAAEPVFQAGPQGPLGRAMQNQMPLMGRGGMPVQQEAAPQGMMDMLRQALSR